MREDPTPLGESRAAPPFRFGRCDLDVRTCELCCDGKPVRLEPRAFDLLVFLIAHRDRVVTSRELIDAVWGGVVVTPSSVSRAVHKARRAAGDDGERQQVIATLHGRGFRFVADLERPGAMRRARGRDRAPGRSPSARSSASIP